MRLDANAPRLILAPLQGFTDAVFRTTFAEHFTGFDSALAPFVATMPAERIHDRYFRDLLPERNQRLRIEPQILGNDVEGFILVGRRLGDLGYPDVNWNLGCPFRPVTKKRRGAGLLPFPEQVGDFLEKVLPAIPGRLSVKLRLGLKSPLEILKLLPVLNRHPLREIVIHPRTARQMYGGRPDLEAFELCAQASRHPVVYNGDIVSLRTYNELSARFTDVAGWMIGRGALSDPFLPEAITSGAEAASFNVQRFQAFYEDLFGRYREALSGPGHLLDRMKGFWTYFGVHFQKGAALCKRIHRTYHLPAYLELVARFFEEEAQWVAVTPGRASGDAECPAADG
ncbi:MAG: tRNA-dihydrouridine synthase family protein [Desulfobacterales bacterium]|jgi:tRNA-dihydrouridine synthase|nr:tRNA-dihydrouridine synthase family protein [Desulfobacterales bacterium]